MKLLYQDKKRRAYRPPYAPGIIPAAAGFDPNFPLSISGLQAWYDADDASTFTFSSGNVVSQWNDKSGNARHLTQGTVANQPTRSGVLNGRTTVVFDGVNDGMASALTASSRTQGTFVVLKPTASGVKTIRGSSGNGNQFRTNAFVLETLKQSVALLHGLGPTLVLNTPAQVSQILSTTNVEHRKDGASQIVADATAFAAGTTLTVGYNVTIGTEPIACELAEMIVVDPAPSPAAIEAWLKAKWGTP